MLGCAYTCVKTIYSYRLFSFRGFVSGVLSEDIVVGVASTKLYFSGKLSKLRCSFLLCNYVMYRRTF